MPSCVIILFILCKGMKDVKLNGNSHKNHPAKEPPQKKEKRQKPKKRGSVLAVVLSCILGLLVLAVGAYTIWERAPEQKGDGLYRPTVETTAAPTQAPESTPRPTPQPTPDTDRNHNIYNVLVAGRDKVGANTDTILIVSLNTEAHTVNVVSIPRDTMVNIPSSVKKVNVLYELGLNKGEDAGQAFLDGMQDLLGFALDGYAVINIQAFEKLVDAIGGVYYDVPVDMFYNDPTQDLSIAIPKGYQWLSGADALKVVRFRAGYANADIGRIGTQQDFLKSVASQVLTVGNIPNLPKIIDILTDEVDTNFSAANISFFAREFLMCSSDNINFHTMPGNYNDSVDGFSYVTVDVDAWLDMVNEYLNPWPQDVTEANVNILTRKDGALYATTGVIAGGRNSFLNMKDYLASLNS